MEDKVSKVCWNVRSSIQKKEQRIQTGRVSFFLVVGRDDDTTEEDEARDEVGENI